MIRSFIGLGSNLDDPLQQIRRAQSALSQVPQTHLLACSRLYCSPPFGPPYDQPDYLNAVVALETELSPLVLLKALQAIENQQGRGRTQRWGSRTLDLDLLLYGNQQLQTPELTLPHPGLMTRPFVIYPLADIDPSLTFPNGTLLSDLLKKTVASDLMIVNNP
ncbi:MAG: 2-amino-4-hydroxy-6-hydroxymethyldihydropteridine diphosphokinase [Candidatus Symbiodolus clandestinus]